MFFWGSVGWDVHLNWWTLGKAYYPSQYGGARAVIWFPSGRNSSADCLWSRTASWVSTLLGAPTDCRLPEDHNHLGHSLNECLCVFTNVHTRPCAHILLVLFLWRTLATLVSMQKIKGFSNKGNIVLFFHLTYK